MSFNPTIAKLRFGDKEVHINADITTEEAVLLRDILAETEGENLWDLYSALQDALSEVGK